MVSERHAFLSYVQEDADAVDELEVALKAADLPVWRDVNDLWPGQDWKAAIRAAIQQGALAMIVCVSTTSTSKAKTYQNEELALAVDEIRLRQPGAQWLFVVRLDDCTVPSFDLGAGRNLSSLQYVDLFGPSKQVNLVRLLTTVGQLVRPALSGTDVASAVLQGQAAAREENLTQALVILLRDPNGDIALEARMDEVAETALRELQQVQPESRTIAHREAVEVARETMRASEIALKPLTEALILASSYGFPQHARAWRRAAEFIAELYDPEAGSYWGGLRAYPLVWLIQATAVAAVSRNNFDALRAVAVDTTIPTDSRLQEEPAGGIATVSTIFSDEGWLASAVVRSYDQPDLITDELLARLQSGYEGKLRTPVSDLLHTRLRPFFAREIRSDVKYAQLFDDGSIVLDALAIDHRLEAAPQTYTYSYPGFGRHTSRYQRPQKPPEVLMASDSSRVDALLRAGLFGGSVPRLQAAFSILAEEIAQVRRQRRFS